jgi:hypothetical protein
MLFCLTVGNAQQRSFGELNGDDWQGFYRRAQNFYSKVNLDKIQDWINTNAYQFKSQFILGLYEMATRVPKEHYYKGVDEDGNDLYISLGNPYPYLNGLTPDQVIEGLDKFYSHNENMNIKILDAIHIVQMEVTGKKAEEVEWQVRYYRADKETREKMARDKMTVPRSKGKK